MVQTVKYICSMDFGFDLWLTLLAVLLHCRFKIFDFLVKDIANSYVEENNNIGTLEHVDSLKQFL